ncbi:T9SS type A sorting domain-containing protein [Neolewinella litorea]|uniref:T9SS type A sorting domain-containing protein n=1 Tax=Neolewinella litorea TaxID=2562452 RepID=A0A4S4NLK4_9BACT|nr:T9SS type A sorting domain-containing protein [Neolewinella litorea]THH40672.1 T9SS type A sorting domain-containing protein [Neolewinella litorea]
MRFLYLSLLVLLAASTPARAQFVGGFGSGATASGYEGQAQLPLTLLHFKAETHGDGVELAWSTIDESGASHFLVERTADGRTFSPVGRAAAAGNAKRATVLHYQLIDPAPLSGSALYRLKAIDLDGSFTYSDLVEVNRGDDHEPLAFAIHPNPSTGGTVGVEVQALNAAEPLLVEVLDATGRRLATRNYRVIPGDYLQVQLADRLPAGTYLLRLSQPGSGSRTSRLIVGPAR